MHPLCTAREWFLKSTLKSTLENDAHEGYWAQKNCPLLLCELENVSSSETSAIKLQFMILKSGPITSLSATIKGIDKQ